MYANAADVNNNGKEQECMEAEIGERKREGKGDGTTRPGDSTNEIECSNGDTIAAALARVSIKLTVPQWVGKMYANAADVRNSGKEQECMGAEIEERKRGRKDRVCGFTSWLKGSEVAAGPEIVRGKAHTLQLLDHSTCLDGHPSPWT